MALNMHYHKCNNSFGQAVGGGGVSRFLPQMQLGSDGVTHGTLRQLVIVQSLRKQCELLWLVI